MPSTLDTAQQKLQSREAEGSRIAQTTRRRLDQLQTRIENKDAAEQQEYIDAINTVSEEIVDIETILTDEFIRQYLLTK